MQLVMIKNHREPGLICNAGEVVDLPEGRARKWIHRGLARKVETQQQEIPQPAPTPREDARRKMRRREVR